MPNILSSPSQKLPKSPRLIRNQKAIFNLTTTTKISEDKKAVKLIKNSQYKLQHQNVSVFDDYDDEPTSENTNCGQSIIDSNFHQLTLAHRRSKSSINKIFRNQRKSEPQNNSNNNSEISESNYSINRPSVSSVSLLYLEKCQ